MHGVLSWMDETTMEDILQSHMEEFSSESVQELEKTLSTENEESPEVEPLNLTAEHLAEFFKYIGIAIGIIDDKEPTERGVPKLPWRLGSLCLL